MDDLNYYQIEPGSGTHTDSVRFPKNHVKFSPILKMLQLVKGAYKLLGSDAFLLSAPMLKSFESAPPYDKHQGTEQELDLVRTLMLSYCSGIDQNPYISPIGRYLLKTMGMNMLKNRRKVLQFYDLNKAYIEEHGNFNAPVIITGSARSGTTLLQRLLSEDPNTRAPYTYELEVPLPPLKNGVDPLQDSRIKKSSAGIKTLQRLAPGFMEKFAESHFWDATEMEESFVYALAHNGINEMNSISAGKAHLHDLMQTENKGPFFQYERLFYTMLDAFCPAKSHWTLKSPDYTFYFPHIFNEFPDSKIVITHRNPLFTLPSLCRIWESWCIAFDQDGAFDKYRFGQLIKLVQDKYLRVPFEFRREHPEYEERIFDCIYEEFFADPISVVKKMYKKFNLLYTEEFEEGMRKYLINNQQGKFGRHTYTLEEYGFEAEHLYQEYIEYMDHFGFGIPDKMERPASFKFVNT
jgi:hypothetical protein